MYNYKGIFYNDEKEKKYYEGGAHFKYSDLVKKLLTLKENREKLCSVIPKNSLQNLTFLNNKNETIKNEEKSRVSPKSNLLTINDYPIQKNNIKIINTHKYILSTDKDIEKEKAKKKRLIELLNYNTKLSPFKSNHKNIKRIFRNGNNSLEQNYIGKSLKTLGNNDNCFNKKNYLSLYINNDKKTEINIFPLIQSLFYNNLSNKNLHDLNNNKINSIKDKITNMNHISKFTDNNRLKISKDNLFVKNKKLSPNKNMSNNRKNDFSNDFSEINKNYKFDTINILKKRNQNFNNGKFWNYMNNNINKEKNTNMNINIKINDFSLNKKD